MRAHDLIEVSGARLRPRLWE